VTWNEPSARLIVPIPPATPGLAVSEVATLAGTVYGGHALAHTPVQLLTLVASLVDWYRVMPFEALKKDPNLPPPELFKVSEKTGIGLALVPTEPVGGVGDVADVGVDVCVVATEGWEDDEVIDDNNQ
jgi:hypothetical protein